MLLSSGGSAAISCRNLSLVALAAIGLAGCGSTAENTGTAGNAVTNAVFGAPNTAQQGAIVVNAENFGFTSTTDCPPVAIRPGTESVVTYQAGQKINPELGEKPTVQYQSTIVDTARECRKTATGVAVKVGVKGRTVAGPAGKAGTVTLPIRIVVMQGTDKVVKSELYKVPVSLQEPDLAANFTKIDDTIELPIAPGNTDYRIYVGFDDSGAKKRGG
ncbi:hypothetical protein C3941_09875 [Kaistia algarum]|uniref:hypothetical protein n=1 Tax=Kaistia algarum TaxID=2083279 RepID=UPI000CE7593A|nr:hypothetical protein [Kaistia algarum]MCX5512365.1 hypothetical protein [Kaistia algarum]PPE80448.1 hypothetical protein C3941_09875 [Kaistia algarum]